MDDAYIGEIRIVPWNWAPEGWLLCIGQTVLVAQYQALFAVITNQFGGNGQTNFVIPNLQAQAVACAGQGTGLTNRVFAKSYGAETVTLTTSQIPPHAHSLIAGKSTSAVATPAANTYIGRDSSSGAQSYTKATTPLSSLSSLAVSQVGSGQAHENRQPFLTMNYIICYDGEFPVKP